MRKLYKAKWIFDARSKVLEDYAIVVEDDKIISVLPQSKVNDSDYKSVKDFGKSVITPGLVNLFVDLRYTDLETVKSVSLSSWIRRFNKNLRNILWSVKNKSPYIQKMALIDKEYHSLDKKDKIAVVAEGLKRAILNGTTCVATTFSESEFFDIINTSPIITYCFFEVVSDDDTKAKKDYEAVKSRYEQQMLKKADNTFIGISPLSVTNVTKRFWQVLAKYCRKNNILMFTKYMETPEERRWLVGKTEEFDLINRILGYSELQPYEQTLNPVEYLKKMQTLKNKIIIANANELTEEEFKQLSENENVRFMYSPRSSDKCFNKKQAFADVIKYFKGRFGFGTYSEFHNYDFNLLNEAQYINHNKEMTASEVIKHLTVYPAKILGLDHLIGTLEAGKEATFNVYRMNYNEDHNAILSKQNPSYVFNRGKVLVRNNQILF